MRPFRSADLEAFSSFADDPGYRRFLGPGHPGVAQFVANNVAADWVRECSWVIILDDDVVGSIFLGIDPQDAVAELACLLSPRVWGRGIAGEAGRAVVVYAFEVRDMYKLTARAAANNAASRRAMEKAGWSQEGLLRGQRADGLGNRVDEVLYGLTRDVWLALRTRK